MATRNIGTLSVDVIAKIGGFEDGMDAAERRAQRLAGTIEKTTSAGAEGFRRMAEQTRELARLSDYQTDWEKRQGSDAVSSRWARNSQAFEKAHESAKKLVEDGERMKVWQQAFAQTESQDRFLQGLRATAESAGKTRAELLQLQAARAGLTGAGAAEAQKLIASIAATDKSFQSFNKTGRLTALELQQVSFQLQDFFVQVSSGQSPITAFIQQGAQLQGTFGSAGNAIKALTSLINPLKVAIGGAAAVVGVLAIGAKSVEEFNRSLGSLESVLKATGRSELFPGLKEQINTLSRLPGVTKQIATDAVGALVRIPQLAGPIFEDLTKIIADYARITGKELPDAAKDLGQSFADPARGAEQLDKVLGNLSAETLLTVKALTEQGRVIEAQRLLYSELEGRIKGLADFGLTPLETSIRGLSDSWEGLKESFKNSGVFKTILDDVSALIRKFKQDIDDIQRITAFFSGARGQREGGATGSFDAPGGASGSFDQTSEEINKQLKAVMGVASGYETAGNKAQRLLGLQQEIVKSLGAAQAAGVLGDRTREKAVDQIKAIQAQIDSAGKSGRGKEFRDDAAQRELASLREQEAALRAQLLTTEKLTTQQQELAKFEQQIADLKEKKVLTADQKVLLANQDRLRLQLQINAALSIGVQANEDARKEAEKLTRELERQREKAAQMLTDFLSASQAIQQSIADSNRTRGEGYGDLLAGAGGGEQARRQVLEQIQIRREFDRQMQRLNKEAAEQGFLGSALYRDEVAKIRAGLDEAIGLNTAYWEELRRLQGNWVIGAQEATANYVDEVANLAAQVNDLFTSVFKGMEDALVQFVTTGKLSFKSLADSIVADITRIIIRQQITGPLAQSLTGAATGGGFLTSLLGGLFGGARASGGAAYAGSAYLVGEEGPELFVPRSNGSVISADRTRSALGGMSVNNTFVLPPGGYSRDTQQQIAAATARSVERASARNN